MYILCRYCFFSSDTVLYVQFDCISKLLDNYFRDFWPSLYKKDEQKPFEEGSTDRERELNMKRIKK